MITQPELDALILIIQRAPMNQAELLAMNAIVEKLARAQQATNATSNSSGTPGGDDAATHAASPAD